MTSPGGLAQRQGHARASSSPGDALFCRRTSAPPPRLVSSPRRGPLASLRLPAAVVLLYSATQALGRRTLRVHGPVDPNKDGGRRFHAEISAGTGKSESKSTDDVKREFADQHLLQSAADDGGDKNAAANYKNKSNYERYYRDLSDFFLVYNGKRIVDEAVAEDDQGRVALASLPDRANVQLQRARGSVGEMHHWSFSLSAALDGMNEQEEDQGNLGREPPDARLSLSPWQREVYLLTGVVPDGNSLTAAVAVVAVALLLSASWCFFFAKRTGLGGASAQKPRSSRTSSEPKFRAMASSSPTGKNTLLHRVSKAMKVSPLSSALAGKKSSSSASRSAGGGAVSPTSSAGGGNKQRLSLSDRSRLKLVNFPTKSWNGQYSSVGAAPSAADGEDVRVWTRKKPRANDVYQLECDVDSEVWVLYLVSPQVSPASRSKMKSSTKTVLATCEGSGSEQGEWICAAGDDEAVAGEGLTESCADAQVE
eukprot:g430.t1